MKFIPYLLSLLLAVTGLAQSGQTFPRTANTATAMSSLPVPPVSAAPSTLQTALLLGVSAIGNNGGLFYWDYTSTASPDGQNYFLSTNSIYATTGRWIRFPIVPPTPGQVATPTFLPSTSSFSSPINVTISTTTAGASIYYTTDGSDPTSSSTLYTGAITITVTTQFKAIGIKTASTDSEIGSKTYTFSGTVAAPVFAFSPSGAQTYLFSDQVGFPAIYTWSISCATAGASIYWLQGIDTQYTPSIDPPSNLYTGPGSAGISYQWKAIAYKDGVYSTITTATHALELPVIWGYGTDAVPTGAQFRALAGALYNGNPAPDGALRYVWDDTIPEFVYGISDGSYDFSGASTVSDYFFIGWPESYPSPTIVNGFFLTPFPVAMAEAAQGYTDGPENGWYFKLIEVDTGTNYKVYRTYFPIGGGGNTSILVQ